MHKHTHVSHSPVVKPFAVRGFLFLGGNQRGETAETAGVQHTDRPM